MRKTLPFILNLFILFCPFLRVIAGEFPEYPCYRLPAKPLLDGKTEENVWSNIPAATGFLTFPAGRYAVFKQTSFKAGWTENALYLAVTAEEPEPEKITASAMNGDLRICAEDSIEIFLHPQKLDYFFQFMINASGNKWNGIHSVGFGVLPSPPVWNWNVKTLTGKNVWSLEAEIPFSITGIPEAEETWRVNIARNMLTGPASERYTSWAPVKSGFADLKKFGLFVFKQAIISPEKARDVEKHLNWPRKRIEETSNLYSQFKDSLEQMLALDKSEEILRLKQDWKLIQAIAGEKEPGREQISDVFQRTDGILKKTAELKTRKKMLDLLEEQR